MIYSNHDGQIAFESSPSISESGRMLFTPDLTERFAQLVSLRSSSIPILPASNVPLNPERNQRIPVYPNAAERTQRRMAWNPMSGDSTPLIQCNWQLGQNRRQRRPGRRRDTGLSYSSAVTDMGCDGLALPPSGCVIRVDDVRRLKKYYEKAFEAFQQLNCRVIAKAFIKLVEPRKQVNYPYNGRRSPSGNGSERRADPELTKPPWWPEGVKHKEPDHLLKGERITLLVHILRKLGDSHDITADKLRDAGQDVRRSISPPERLHILDEVYSVRHMEERYLRGEISGDVLIPIAQVHLTGSELDETEAAGTADSQGQVEEASWGTGSFTSSGGNGQETTGRGSRSDTRTPDSQASYGSHPSQSLSLTLPNSPCNSSTPASSFDSSLAYSPREYTSRATSSMMSQEPSNPTMGITRRPQRSCVSNYLTQPILAPGSGPATTNVLWGSPLHASAPPFHLPY
ncbi:hypothetical protein BGW36DRAFT_300225 [Talaromyces proteolyticus]|uniref:Subtelomeric hrmA-associated cluster protein AFUB-079030/YDR124W-like helical bundle domain-containing protein n=1 Tax=Talaromyces proteolyticus TaxID=1131652 RepID=A0AAD4KQ47_9EURO|nr:uncharacterized protein BGW36DRAFT_300225 [Talaromyces proteolyticus]KAH8694128.1 hypothetical protein BGW36DRAFT_300225 [Talaromyces proteolyticus]